MIEISYTDLKNRQNDLSKIKQMKFFSKNQDNKNTFYIKDHDTKYVNWSEGHLFKGNIWCSREKYLRNVANIIKDGYPVIRDGTKIFHQNSFKRLFSFKKH